MAYILIAVIALGVGLYVGYNSILFGMSSLANKNLNKEEQADLIRLINKIKGG